MIGMMTKHAEKIRLENKRTKKSLIAKIGKEKKISVKSSIAITNSLTSGLTLKHFDCSYNRTFCKEAWRPADFGSM